MPTVTEREISIWSRVNVGGYIRRLREALRLTQQELGDAAGVSLSMLSHIERGVANLPSCHAPYLAAALEVAPKEFAKVLLKFQEPHLWGMMYPRKAVRSFAVPIVELHRADIRLERRAELLAERKQRREDAASFKRSQS